MRFSGFFDHTFTIFNTSLALFFCVWQLILSFCIYIAVGGKQGDGFRSKCLGIPAELGFDFFFIICLYLAVLFTTIFVFLIASDKWIVRAKSLKLFFLTINIIFIAFLFFEV